MSRLFQRMMFHFKHQYTGKQKAIIVPRPSFGTTNEATWLKWMERHPDAEFTSCNGLYLMIPKN